jgi:RHS repeat-associated protein
MSVAPFRETAPTGSLEFNLRFAGQYYDKETGTHYNINRDYNPVTGRYIQSDPIGLDGGLSTFAYVNGNPVMLVDLEGLCGSSDEDEPKVGRLTTCDGDSSFAAMSEQDKFRNNRNYITTDSILSLSYSTELRSFGIGCAGMSAGMVLLDLYGDNLGRPDPLSFLIKAVYIGKNNDYGKEIEIRYMRDGTIQVWRIK